MKFFLPLLLFITVVMSAFAQTTTVVKGIITDKQTGQPLVGASVKLKGAAFTAVATTGLDGSFVFKQVPAGDYAIHLKDMGHAELTETIQCKADVANNYNFSLEGKDRSLQTLTVKGKGDKTSDRAVRKTVQNADMVLNAVSAQAIEVSPDITIANVMQRVSGVSLERSNNGDGQYAIIRGMDKRYQYTLINGVKIPSPDNKNRFVPLDIFPADLIDRLEVYKALTPNMEGDAIGGATNMVMKDAPNRFVLQANAAIGQAQTLFNQDFTRFDRSGSTSSSPRISNGKDYTATGRDFTNNPLHLTTGKAPLSSVFGISAGGRSKNGKLGAIAGISYQNSYRYNETLFLETEIDKRTNKPMFTSAKSRQYSIRQQRTGLHGKVDYRFNDDQQVSLYAAYMNLGQDQFRFSSDTSLELGRVGPGTGRIGNTYRSERMVQQITNFTLQGDHKLASRLRVNWSAVYSKATSNTPDRTSLNLSTGVTPQPDKQLKQEPSFLDALNGVTHEWARNEDEDKTGYLNFVYTPTILGIPATFTAGGMYRDKQRNSVYDQYKLRPDSATQHFKNNIDEHPLTVFNGAGSADNALNYHFTEKTGAYYGQVKFQIGRLQTLAGVRVEHTNSSWLSNVSEKIAGKSGTLKYTDVLPSIHFKYMPDSKRNIRLSYYEAISRPGFYEVIPFDGGDPDADYTEKGNPYLKRATSNNFDLRYEFFPKALDQVLAGVFYKRIKDPIETALIQDNRTIYLMSGNFGTANNYGFELDVTKFIRQFGIRANYTFTKSTISSDKVQAYREDDGNVTQKTVSQHRPLQGQSQHIANVSLLYKDTKSALDAQLAMVYTGERIDKVSPFLDSDIWQKGFVQLDFSAQKRIWKNLYAYTKIGNLLNTPYELFIKSKNGDDVAGVPHQEPGKNIFIRKNSYGQTYLLGLRFKL
ncbi:TonB-dependent receptor domain-containing protein [Chitinophaga nivalis]|uniref:Outer membrane beta-barrel protein n=1 Tax=Chitinophaga nivalis TaxID=2991709 RepID=A0ABT3IFY7_9BACT|nr:TonB-dependent receptor [Chitinophaga nivalis]MCW3467436.1 outer membrane beta-barrel protein [Chitinophaga nivalis]MCW3482872.1 outer membrane beta-barrel protein [Chitinophaga nivalis]